jgi:hypothetical protein
MYQVLTDEIIRSDRGTLLNYRHGLTIVHLYTEKWGPFWPLKWSKDWFEVTLHRTHPALWQDPTGRFWMSDKHIAKTDLGSVPPPLRGAYPHTEFPVAYVMHDDSYNHGFLWSAETLAGPWEKVAVTRKEADDRLADIIYTRQSVCDCDTVRPPTRCESIQNAIHRGAIYSTVRTFGWFPWRDARNEGK